MLNKIFIKENFSTNLSSGLVVFLVALPLCLGIAMASGAPLFSGVVSGVIGGIVVGALSNSQVSVSGPAAGLTAIILSAITDLGSFNIFLTAVFLAGFIQLVLGFLKAGTVSNYFPNNVIEGMLGGIGVIIFLKQIPHALGYDRDAEGDMTFIENSGENTITALISSFDYIHPGACLIAIISLVILVVWEKSVRLKKLKLLPGALVVVFVGIVLNLIFIKSGTSLAISGTHLVSLPVLTASSDISSFLSFPDFNAVFRSDVWVVAVTIAIVASIETLLCIEAGDRMDKKKRLTNTNTELVAQGIGNFFSGLLGGLPMTSVVVRTTANINAGATTKLSSIIHGFLLLISVITIPFILNMIPLASLAAILLIIGYKLASPSKVKHFWKHGKYQFIPFISTLLAVVFIDLLKGVALGMVISIVFVLKGNLMRAYHFKRETYHDGDIIHIDLAQEVSFLNKAAVKQTLLVIPENSKVIINASNTEYIDHDVLEMIREFKSFGAAEKNIDLSLIGFKDVYKLENSESHIWLEGNNNSGGHFELIKNLKKPIKNSKS